MSAKPFQIIMPDGSKAKGVASKGLDGWKIETNDARIRFIRFLPVQNITSMLSRKGMTVEWIEPLKYVACCDCTLNETCEIGTEARKDRSFSIPCRYCTRFKPCEQ